jgi:hypothetical protein
MFLTGLSGSLARSGEFPGDEVEHVGHVFHRPVPADFRLTAENRLLGPSMRAIVGNRFRWAKNCFQVSFDHPGRAGHLLEQLTVCSRVARTHAHPLPDSFLASAIFFHL